MATRSSILAWEIPWAEEPGKLQSMGSQRVRHTSDHVFKVRRVLSSSIGLVGPVEDVLAWEISWTEELGGLQSTELQNELDAT